MGASWSPALFLLLSGVNSDQGFCWYKPTKQTEQNKNQAQKTPLKPQNKKHILKDLLQHICRGKKGKKKKRQLSQLYQYYFGEYHVSIHQVEAPSPAPPKRTETLKLAHSREKIKGCFFRCCSSTLSSCARQCHLALLNSYIAEVPRGLK